MTVVNAVLGQRLCLEDQPQRIATNYALKFTHPPSNSAALRVVLRTYPRSDLWEASCAFRTC